MVFASYKLVQTLPDGAAEPDEEVARSMKGTCIRLPQEKTF